MATPLVEFLNDGLEAGDAAARQLAGSSPAARAELYESIPPAIRYHTISALMELAHALLDTDAESAAALTEFAVARVDALPVPPEFDVAHLNLRGYAWMERGSALRLTGDLHGALAAFERATAIFSSDTCLAPETEAAARGAALVEHQLGRSEHALQRIRAGLPVLEASDTVGSLVRSRFFEGHILFDLGRYKEAEAAFRAALAGAERLDDEVSIARLHNNIGHCHQKQGRHKEALESLVLALKLFEMHGLDAERARAVWGLAHLQADGGNATPAIAQLERVATDLLAAGLPLQAACVRLDIVELLLIANQPARASAAAMELARVFSDAGMSREARHALELLHEAAATSGLMAKSVDEARRVLTGRVQG